MLTVREALQVAPMQLGLPRVLAGQDHLDRPVRWVHVGEVRNMAMLLEGGELLLTTGIGMGGTLDEQRAFVHALADRGVAALAVELGTVVGEVPQGVVRAAEARSLPLIAFQREVRFVEITEVIHRDIVDREAVLMRRGEAIQQRLTEMMLDGAGIPEVLEALSGTVGNAVFLEKGGRGVVYHAARGMSEAEALALWEQVASGADRRPHAAFGVGTRDWGRLWVLETHAPLRDLERAAVERAAGLVALALLGRRHEDVLAVRQPGRFLCRLLEVAFDEAEARAGAAAMGFGGGAGWVLPLAATRTRSTAAAGDEALWAGLWRDVRGDLEPAGWPLLAGILHEGQDLALVVGLRSPDDREAVAGRVARALRTAAAQHFAAACDIRVAVGAAAVTWSAAAESLREAIDAAGGPCASAAAAWEDASRPDVARLLWTLQGSRELNAFVARRLAPLLEYEQDREPVLLETLRVYLANNGHKAAAARELHLERQSLYHRLERIEQLLDERLDDEDTYLGLHIAVRTWVDGLAAEALPGPGDSVAREPVPGASRRRVAALTPRFVRRAPGLPTA